MSDTDLCARCGGDCGMSDCKECGGCENTGPGMTFRECPECRPGAEGCEGDDEPCYHEHDEECEDEQGYLFCMHTHCFNCGGCQCPGYCDDYQTYNLRPDETGGTPAPSGEVPGDGD